ARRPARAARGARSRERVPGALRPGGGAGRGRVGVAPIANGRNGQRAVERQPVALPGLAAVAKTTASAPRAAASADPVVARRGQPRGGPPRMFRHFRSLLELIRFSHTVFALPFALTGAALAWRKAGAFSWGQLGGILLCMVFARSAAMAFNRLAD